MKPVDPRLLRRATAARRYLVAAVVIGTVTTLCVIAQASLLAGIIAEASTGAGLARVRGALLALGAVIAARALASHVGEVASLRAATAVKTRLRDDVLTRSVALGPRWLAGRRAGEVSTLLTSGLDALDGYFARYLPQLVLAAIVPVAVLVRISVGDLGSALVIIATLPLVPLFMVLIGVQTRSRTDRQWRLMSRLGGHFLDVVEGLPTLKAFGRARAQVAVVREATDGYRQATMASLRWAFLSGLALDLLGTIAIAVVAVEVGLRLLSGHVGYPTALLVLILTPEVYLPLRNVGAQFHASMNGVSAAADAFAILETPAPPPPRGRAAVPDLRTATVRLQNVTVTYPDRTGPALDRVDLAVRPGERLVVEGPSGAGKSTVVSLLLGFLAPTAGRITAGGIDLADLDPADWRRQLAWVPQAPYLFSGSIADNVRLGEPDADDATVRAALGLAGAGDLVDSLPDGLATVVGERGARLSSGQRQRIALARAFLRDAPLLLLDEPTAHLDPITAAGVRDALVRLMAGRTVLLVAHSGGFAASADRVVRFEAGRVVADSTAVEPTAVEPTAVEPTVGEAAAVGASTVGPAAGGPR